MKTPIWGLLCLLVLPTFSCKQDKPAEEPETTETAVRVWAPEDTRSMTGATARRGVILDTEKDTEGYVLFEVPMDTDTYLIDKQGKVVHTWEGSLNSMNSYLLPNGHLIRLERDEDFPTFAAGGQSGRIREYDWDGTLLWDYELANETELLHHDIEIMPNGHILGISYEAVTAEEAAAMGRDPGQIPRAGLWMDKIVEIRPTRPVGGEIVWEWHMKDHLVQDLDPEKPNYGAIGDHPRKIDFNVHVWEESPEPEQSEEERLAHLQKMIALGNETSNATLENQGSDISHFNAVSYNPDLDQIAISCPEYCEIFIIDHSTSTEEARGDAGGRWGHGGDLLYRWGNPANYGQGSKEDQVLFYQHDIKWIPGGFPGGGNLMVYNNDIPDPDSDYDTPFAYFDSAVPPDFAIPVGKAGNHSEVYQWSPPVDENGNYLIGPDHRFGPQYPDWTYKAPDIYSFYSAFISGAQRLSNGHTLITQGMQGRLFEINADKELVWEYWVPYKGDYRLPDGTFPQPNGPFIYAVFRSTLYPAGHPAFSGRDLVPAEPQPEAFKFPGPPENGPGGNNQSQTN